jgi:hypothetical protein
MWNTVKKHKFKFSYFLDRNSCEEGNGYGVQQINYYVKDENILNVKNDWIKICLFLWYFGEKMSVQMRNVAIWTFPCVNFVLLNYICRILFNYCILSQLIEDIDFSIVYLELWFVILSIFNLYTT